MKTFLIALIALSPSLSFGKRVTLKLHGGAVTVTFDSAKISKEQFKAAQPFAPWENPGPNIHNIDDCEAKDARYQDCGSAKPVNAAFLANAQVNVGLARQEGERFAAMAAPKELEPARDFLRAESAFYADGNDALLGFLRSGDSARLKGKIGDVDGSKTCTGFLAQIEKAATPELKYPLASSWLICVRSFHQARYPEEPWKAFLKVNEIREKFDTSGAD